MSAFHVQLAVILAVVILGVSAIGTALNSFRGFVEAHHTCDSQIVAGETKACRR